MQESMDYSPQEGSGTVRDRNNFASKLKRTLTSVLPVDPHRVGECDQCGKCCVLPVPCPFYDSEKGEKRCSIYPVRPPQCRKYPRTAEEQIVFPCGYSFPER